MKEEFDAARDRLRARAAEIDLPRSICWPPIQAHTCPARVRGVNQRTEAARGFLRRWPDPQAWADEPLATRLALPQATRPFITFLMLQRASAAGL